MIRALVLLLLLSPATAFAGGINFAWNTCLPEGGTERAGFDCTSNDGAHVAVGSFMLDAPQANFQGIEIYVDILASTPTTFPDWWQFKNSGSCRQTALSMSLDFTGFPNAQCNNPWAAEAAGGIAAYRTWTNPPAPGGPNQALLLMAAAIPNPTPLAANVEFYAFQLRMSHARTTGTGACAGCGTGVCLRLREIRAFESDNSFQRLTGPLAQQYIAWQCGTPQTGLPHGEYLCSGSPDCPTPVQATSWGQIKGLYR